ncbi:hypothetical protein B0H34DRAFT_788187, partial [Crassisporium funariophilum]
MSYASVAAHNAPPLSEQPHPDTALLNTTPPTHSNVADDAAKVNIVGPDFKQDLHTITSEADRIFEDTEHTYTSPNHNTSSNNNNGGGKPRKSSRRLQEVEAESLYIWETAKHYLIRPGVAGGLVGIVNIGLLALAGRTFYMRPHLRRDATAISSAVAATIALISAEGFAAEKYRNTPQGREDERKVKNEGALIFRHLHDQILRPGVLGGLVGLINSAVLGTLGYFAYINWNKPWDRRTISAVSVGLLSLWGGEGFLAERLGRSGRK